MPVGDESSICHGHPQLDWLFDDLAQAGQGEWVEQLRASHRSLLSPEGNGHWTTWCTAIDRLPTIAATRVELNRSAVTLAGDCTLAERARVESTLKGLHPWRKGPFHLFGVDVDAEWRCDKKWNRLADHVDLRGKRVLDVGCGNGYYGWRMLGAGAECVVGLEPYPLYNAQYLAIHHYAPDARNFVVAAPDRILAKCRSGFDTAFSMGVFYHTKNPIGHLELLRGALRAGGTLVLETLVVEGTERTALIPEARYAKMRNVWFIPSTDMLVGLLRRTGFDRVTVIDVGRTELDEQRSTDWMTFESLKDFLDPTNPHRTIEGYPGPTRAMIVARTR